MFVDGVSDEIHEIAQAQLLEEPCFIRADGLFIDCQLAGDLQTFHSFHEQSEHLSFTVGEDRMPDGTFDGLSTKSSLDGFDQRGRRPIVREGIKDLLQKAVPSILLKT
jgi:hypothetical protein